MFYQVGFHLLKKKKNANASKARAGAANEPEAETISRPNCFVKTQEARRSVSEPKTLVLVWESGNESGRKSVHGKV